MNLSNEYLRIRMWGLVFGFGGMVYISLYTGLTKTNPIMYATALLAVVNIFLNYLLIYGNWGFPELGIKGAAWASLIAEGIALLGFILFSLSRKESKKYRLYSLAKFDGQMILNQLKLSLPIALQSLLGLGSWFFFFSLIENLGEEAMAISSAVRVEYLFLGAICWGFGTASNAIVSNLIGEKRQESVLYALNKLTFLSLIVTLACGSVLFFFPTEIMQLISPDAGIQAGGAALAPLLFVILVVSAIFSVYYQGLVGTGAILPSLGIQLVTAMVYVAFVFWVVRVYQGNLMEVWTSELVYSVTCILLCVLYLRSKAWLNIRI